MKRKVFTGILVLILVLIGVVFYLFYKPHRNAESEKAAYKLSASQLVKEYSENEEASNKKYLDKVIEVEGVVGEVLHDTTWITIVLKGDDDLSVGCTIDQKNEDMKNADAAIKEGDKIFLKGICTGYDGIMEVKLNKCIIFDPLEK